MPCYDPRCSNEYHKQKETDLNKELIKIYKSYDDEKLKNEKLHEQIVILCNENSVYIKSLCLLCRKLSKEVLKEIVVEKDDFKANMLDWYRSHLEKDFAYNTELGCKKDADFALQELLRIKD